MVTVSSGQRRPLCLTVIHPISASHTIRFHLFVGTYMQRSKCIVNYCVPKSPRLLCGCLTFKLRASWSLCMTPSQHFGCVMPSPTRHYSSSSSTGYRDVISWPSATLHNNNRPVTNAVLCAYHPKPCKALQQQHQIPTPHLPPHCQLCVLQLRRSAQPCMYTQVSLAHVSMRHPPATRPLLHVLPCTCSILPAAKSCGFAAPHHSSRSLVTEYTPAAAAKACSCTRLAKAKLS